MRSLLPLMCAVAGALREMQGALQLDESEVMEGYCDAKAGQNEYEGFCQGLWKPACDVQIVCEWMPEHCTAKPGMSAYKQMCGKVGSSVICEMQRFCQWKGGASMAGAQLGEGYCDAKGGKNEYKRSLSRTCTIELPYAIRLRMEDSTLHGQARARESIQVAVRECRLQEHLRRSNVLRLEVFLRLPTHADLHLQP